MRKSTVSAQYFTPILLSFALLGCVKDVSGAWTITAVCPKESKLGETTVTATAAMQETSKANYQGSIINSFGQKGELKVSLSGKTMAAKVAWQGSGTTEALLSLDKSGRVYVGTDTEGCTLSVRRP